jgi:hypothetical protein
MVLNWIRIQTQEGSGSGLFLGSDPVQNQSDPQHCDYAFKQVVEYMPYKRT